MSNYSVLYRHTTPIESFISHLNWDSENAICFLTSFSFLPWYLCLNPSYGKFQRNLNSRCIFHFKLACYMLLLLLTMVSLVGWATSKVSGEGRLSHTIFLSIFYRIPLYFQSVIIHSANVVRSYTKTFRRVLNNTLLYLIGSESSCDLRNVIFLSW
jgi:hypothetical protein